MAGVVHIPWYATLFRGDRFEAAIAEVAPAALRYGALDYDVYRSRDDAYKFLQTACFEHKEDFTRYWEGPEMTAFRSRHSGWFQVPVVYVWHDRVTHGSRASAESVTPAA